MWHFVMNRISSLPQKFLALRRNFNKVYSMYSYNINVNVDNTLISNANTRQVYWPEDFCGANSQFPPPWVTLPTITSHYLKYTYFSLQLSVPKKILTMPVTCHSIEWNTGCGHARINKKFRFTYPRSSFSFLLHPSIVVAGKYISCHWPLYTPYLCVVVKAIHGVDQEQARWRTCVNYVNENFGMAVGRIFIEKHFSEESKANVSWLVIHRRFIETQQRWCNFIQP